MTTGTIIAIIAFGLFMVGMIAGNIIGLLMMEEVDRRRPELNLYSLFSAFNRRLDRGFEMFREYRRLCPEGKLHIYELACFAVAGVGMIVLIILGSISIAAHG
jgi:hypothetical protein